MRLSLSQRLERLNTDRARLIGRMAKRRAAKRGAKDVERDLVLVTAKVLKFERKAEKVK